MEFWREREREPLREPTMKIWLDPLLDALSPPREPRTISWRDLVERGAGSPAERDLLDILLITISVLSAVALAVLAFL